jgi:ankyrin repeat protein
MPLFLWIIIAIVILVIALIAFFAWYLRETVPLIKAIKQNRTRDALALIENGADVNVRNEVFETPLYHAARLGNLEVARMLLSRNAEVDVATIAVKDTPLMMAAVYGHPDIVRLLIVAGADVNAKDWDNRHALIGAARSSSFDAVDQLLTAGAEVNAKAKDGETALAASIGNNSTEVARRLIKAGADLKNINKHGSNALESCMYGRNYEMAAELYDEMVAAGLDIHVKREYDVNTLSAAVSCALREEAKGDHPLIQVIKKLVNAGVDARVARGIAVQHYAPEFFDRYKRELIDILDGK